MNKNVWLYFGNAQRTLMVPANRLRGMVPYSDGKLKLDFNSIVNTVNTPTDKAVLNLFEDNTHLDVMKAISRAINNDTPTFDGFIVVADNTTSFPVGFHKPEFLTEKDGTESGKIASVDELIIQDSTTGSITATTAADFAGGANIPRAGVWYISSDDANKVIHLPKAFNGARVELLGSGSGYELRALDSSNFINGANGEVESAIPANAVRVTAYAVNNTTWTVTYYDNLGNFDHIAVADAI